MRPWLVLLMACTSEPKPESPADSEPVVDTELVDTVVDTDLPEDPCLTEPTELRIGIGTTAFNPLARDQNVFMVRGTSGVAWHIDVAAQLRNVPETVIVDTELRRLSGEIIAGPHRRPIALVPLGGPGTPWTGCGSRVGQGPSST